ncbi:MAG: hemerythrin domain-containing protein [Oligoflexia bacterium]|nr:hemerythrin domain-containing protein [Oligoflexia bacterium]
MENDLFNTLQTEHKEIKSIFGILKSEKSPEKRDNSLSSLQASLIPHLRAEERVIYSELFKNSQSKELGLEAVEEHYALRLMLEELFKMPNNSDRFNARANVTLEILAHHIDEEEKKIFPKMKEIFNSEQLNNFLKKFSDEKQVIKEKKGVLLNILHTDHEEVKTILNKLKNEKSSYERNNSLQMLEGLLIPHMKAEENVIYKELLKFRESQELALRSLEEHYATRTVMEELYEMRINSERFSARVNIVTEMVNHHILEEEKDLFEKLKELFDREQLNDLTKIFTEEKKVIKRRYE